MLFKFAFRNVFRNRRRSLLTGLAIFFAGVIAVFSMGYMIGVLDMMMDNFTKYITGSVKVTTEDYIEREKFLPVDELIYNSAELMDEIRKIEGVVSVEDRVRFGILLGRGAKTVTAMGIGVDLEKTCLDIKNNLSEGEFSPEGLYIGVKLAQKIGAQIGDELLLATNTSEGGLNGMKFRVNGLIQMQVASMDERVFYIAKKDAKRLLKMKGASTEIYVFTDRDDMMPVSEVLLSRLDKGLTARTAKAQIGAYWDMIESYKGIIFFIEILILALASFVVVNTMMQSIFERLSEIGTLKALGMTDGEIQRSFTMEGGIIGTFGGLIGAIAGYVLTLWVNKVGINMESALSGMDYPMTYVIRPYTGIEILFITVFLAIIVTSIAAYFPARYAKKLSAAEALRKL